MWALLWHGLPVAALLLWGAFCITNSLWYDEAYSASMVSLPWKRLIYITATDDHSPFYYVLLKSFYHLCGGGTHFWALKLMSVLFMLDICCWENIMWQNCLIVRFRCILCCFPC